MATTISKSIGEGFAHNPIYAALAYDTNDYWGGYQIKDVMFNTTYKAYFYDASAYINSSTSGTLDLVATTIAITGNVTISGSLSYGSETVSLSQDLQGTLTVGVDDQGYDVKFYGDGTGKYWLWDTDKDTNEGGVTMVGTFGITGAMTITGAASVSTTLAVAGNTTITAGTLTVGLTTAGTDVKFFGTTSTYQWLWDANADTHGGVVMKGTFHITGAATHIGTLTVGVNNTGHDVIFYGATDAKYWKWDETNDQMTIAGDTSLAGAVTIVGAVGITGDVTMATSSQINFYDTTQYIKASTDAILNILGPTIDLEASTAIIFDGDTTIADAHTFTSGTGNISLTGAITITNTLTVGSDGTGYDIRLYSATAGCSVLWDETEDQLIVTQTNAATSGVERTVDISQTHTGIGASAEALRVVVTTNVAGGTWLNAIFGEIDFSTVGKVTGLAGVICSELTMAGGAVSEGTYATYQAEINLPANYSSSVPISIMRINTWGTQNADFDTYGYLFDIAGITIGDDKFFTTATNTTIDHALKIRVGGVTYWIGLYDARA